MQGIALALLLAAAVVYVGATALLGRHAAFGYLAAFAEAAMVGAIADWFAVVALFRHPLGLPIPHTAIIPSSQERIGDNLAEFICMHFLSDAQVLDKLERLDASRRIAIWLAAPRHAERVGRYVAEALVYGLSVLDDDRVRAFFRRAVLERLEAVDIAPLAGRVLAVLTEDGRHQRLLDGVLQQLAHMLDDDAVRRAIAEVVAAEVKYLRFVGLDQVAGRYATEKMVAAVVRLVGEMGGDPRHPLRTRFDDFVAGFVVRLQDDPLLRAKGEALKAELLAHPAVATYLHGLWSELLGWLQADLAKDDSRLRRQVVDGTRSLGEKLLTDADMRAWINEQLREAAPRWIARYREDIRRAIVTRVRAWDPAELTREVERNIGRDLQFIRINGTLVGGLVGLAIHAATQLARPG
ncbi:MAG TPA: DUF445 domain-containing protein [Caldimonas sp.]|nr:DUF445 domain-containing protein [Caldimonas sp.]